MPSDPGIMLLSSSETVPLVLMLFPLQPGYTMTVWAAANEHQVATTKASSVKRNMAGGGFLVVSL
jgi:hypothetical protein